MTDPDSLGVGKRRASAYSTGGGGYTFERRVAVRYLAAMLSGSPRPELGDRQVVRVAFQQPTLAPFDDLHVLAAREDEKDPSLELWVAVRRRLRFVRSDENTQKLVATLVKASATPEAVGCDRLFIVCVARWDGPTSEVAALADLARANLSEGSFLRAVDSAKQGLRIRYQYLVDLATSSTHKGDGVSIWGILRKTRVQNVRVESPDEEDWAALLGELRDWSRDQNLSGAEALRTTLVSLADQYAPEAAEVDRTTLRRAAYPLLHSRRRLLDAAWDELRRLEEEARDAVRVECGTGPSVTLPREAERNRLAGAFRTGGVLLVSGESGTGKSALVCSALEHLAASSANGFESVYLNLRDLPARPVELRSALGAPLDRILEEMAAPGRLLVVDGADRAAETEETLLAAVVRDAARADVAMWVVAATAVVDTVKTIVTAAAGKSPERHVVPPLTDEEIGELARALPSLRTIAGNRRARGLLLRPVIADYLARAGGHETPLSESGAMDVIWFRLVRSDTRRGRRLPDARDQTMRRIARSHLRSEDPDQVYSDLDGEAIDGLKRDGLLRDSRLPWSPLPGFAHDTLRDFAVAKVLLSTGNPAERLRDFGAPRWALSAARLAIESSLRNSDDKIAMLEQQQRLSDEIAEDSAEARWSDLPTEAALRVPEAGDLLAGSWERLIADGASGLRRVLRLVSQQYTKDGGSDLRVSRPVAALLVERGWPTEVNKEVDTFLGAWLRALVADKTRSGNESRIRLRTLIEDKVAAADQQGPPSYAAVSPRLVRRTDRETSLVRKGKPGSPSKSSVTHRQRERLPRELLEKSTVTLLALLGADLGSSGEALLRRVARTEPRGLKPAVETPMAGYSIAQHDPGLLLDLIEAYYIEDGNGNSPSRSGIRPHRFGGLLVPMAAYYRGPFIAMFRYDFRGGVACLNRILNHAARVETRRGHADAHRIGHQGVEMSVTGEPRSYLGDPNAWFWYRVIATGPNPCTSALQALELVCDQILAKGSMPPEELIRLLLSGCENLAMVSMAYGIMVRHIEDFDGIIDPFLAEPYLWGVEVSRVNREYPGLVDGSATVDRPERRKWTPRHVILHLLWAMDPDAKRVQEIKSLGNLYSERAKRESEGTSDPTDQLAVVLRNTLAFDRGEYKVTRSGNQFQIQQRIDPELQTALAHSTKESRHVLEAFRLQDRYTERSDRIVNPDPPDIRELQRDISTAKALLVDPPPLGPLDREAPAAAVAAATLEFYFLDGIPIAMDDLSWAARALAKIVRGRIHQQTGSPQGRVYTLSPYWEGAEREAARGLPLLLLEHPGTREILERLASEGLDERAVQGIIRWLFTHAPLDALYAASRALDPIWRSPCNPQDECSHRQGLNLIEQSLRHRAIRRPPTDENLPEPNLADPLCEILESASSDHLAVACLSPALRALGAEALSRTCVHGKATKLLAVVLRSHLRARRSSTSGGRDTRWVALCAARAVLQRASVGDESALRERITGFAKHYDGLWECLMALAAVAEESPDLAAAAHNAWPWVIREGLRILNQDTPPDLPEPGDQSTRDMAFSALIPNRAPEGFYTYREMPDGRLSWTSPESWLAEIDQWVAAATGTTENTDNSTDSRRQAVREPPRADGMFGSIDALIGMLSELPVERQTKIGIRWVEQLAVSAGCSATRTWSLPEWLRNVQPHCGPQERQAWQSILDHLLVHGDRRVSDLAD